MTDTNLSPPRETGSAHRPLKPKELAEALNVSHRWVLDQYGRGLIPALFHRGKVIRFDLEQALEALSE